MMNSCRPTAAVLVSLCVATTVLGVEPVPRFEELDWPTYRHDSRRSGYSPHGIEAPRLAMSWEMPGLRRTPGAAPPSTRADFGEEPADPSATETVDLPLGPPRSLFPVRDLRSRCRLDAEPLPATIGR